MNCEKSYKSSQLIVKFGEKWKNSTVKNILHVSYSKTGGAGSVANRLASAQSNLKNYQSRFLYSSQGGVRSNPFENIQLTTRSLIDEFLVKRREWPTLFSLYRNIQNSKIEELVRAHDGIIHLHWLNGILETRNLVNYVLNGKKIVWTIHDMAPFTGGCHYSVHCRNFEKTCANCPAVRGLYTNRITQTKTQKNELFEQLNKISYVFPSKWLLDNFKLGIPDKTLNLEIIPNPLPSLFFQNIGEGALNNNNNNKEKVFVLGFVSRDLNDSIKQFKDVVDSLQEVSFLIKKPLKLIAVGSRFKNFPKRLNFEVYQPGLVSDAIHLRELYSKMDLLISSSISESFGLSIAEAAACGVPSLVLRGSGSSELVIDNQTGILINDLSALTKNIFTMANHDSFRLSLGENAKINSIKQWHIDSIVKKYDSLYENLN
jgi:glycosyltransferase involved in cell wall biosynthesis